MEFARRVATARWPRAAEAVSTENMSEMESESKCLQILGAVVWVVFA